MTQDAPLSEDASAGQTTAHVVHTLHQFYRVVRYRKVTVLLVMGAFLAIGFAYFVLADRYYESSAQLLVLQTSASSGGRIPGQADEAVKQSLMPTFVRLILSDRVIADAISNLDEDYLVDLDGVPRSAWVKTLAKNLSASSLRRTNILEVSYRSREPQAAAAVVTAIVNAYLKFMNETHASTASQVVRVLHNERVQLKKRLDDAERRYTELSRWTGNVGLLGDRSEVHPTVRRALRLNEAWVELHTKRLAIAAALNALQYSIRNGEDIHQHALAVEKTVGQQVMMNMIGMDRSHAQIVANLQQDLLDVHAERRSLLKTLGPNHPDVDVLNEQIAGKESFLYNYRDEVRRDVDEMADKQLGPLLDHMLQTQLAQTTYHEQSVAVDFKIAQDAAVELNGNLHQLKSIDKEIGFYQGMLDELIQQLARMGEVADQGGIKTAVTQDPTVAKNPVWPRLPFIGFVALVAGLFVGCGVVYVMDVLDDRFRSPEEMQDQLRVPVLAIVRRLENLADAGIESLQVHAAPDAAESEAFRTLRTTLTFNRQETSRMVVSSPEPGDGKTTVLANLAVTYAQSGKKVLIIDADLRRPGLTKLLGLRGTAGLSSLLRADAPLAQMAAASICASGIEGLDVLGSGPRPTNPAELLNGERFSELLAWAETVYDQILIDSPPTLAASDAAVIGRIVDGVLLVVQPEKNQRRSVVRAADTFISLGIDLVGIIVNRASGEKDGDFYGYGGYGYSGYGGGDDEFDDNEAGDGDIGGDIGGDMQPPEVISRHLPDGLDEDTQSAA